MENEVITILLMVLGIALIMRHQNISDSKKIDNLFKDREPLTDEEFYNKFFLNDNVSKDVVFKIKKILEDHLGVNLSRLHKDDSFASNLNFFFDIDDMADVEIIMSLEEEFSITISNEEAKNTFSIGDIVQLVSKKIR